MYFLKIRGKARIPDFIQVRDDDFTLIGYFRLNSLEKNIERLVPGATRKQIESIREQPYGSFLKIDNPARHD